MEKLVTSPEVGERVKPSTHWNRGNINYFCKGVGTGMDESASGHGSVTGFGGSQYVVVTWDSGHVDSVPLSQLAYVENGFEGLFNL